MKKLLASTALTLSIIAGGQSVAHAAWSDCLSGQGCAWQHPNATGTVNRGYSDYTFNSSLRNQDSSWFNNGNSCALVVWDGYSKTNADRSFWIPVKGYGDNSGSWWTHNDRGDGIDYCV